MDKEWLSEITRTKHCYFTWLICSIRREQAWILCSNWTESPSWVRRAVCTSFLRWLKAAAMVARMVEWTSAMVVFKCSSTVQVTMVPPCASFDWTSEKTESDFSRHLLQVFQRGKSITYINYGYTKFFKIYMENCRGSILRWCFHPYGQSAVSTLTQTAMVCRALHTQTG